MNIFKRVIRGVINRVIYFPDYIEYKKREKRKKRLKNTDFSLIASNCNGGIMLNDLGLRFNSPFINLWLKPDDYIKLLNNLDYYLNCPMMFVKEDNITYPIGELNDVRIYFQHYETNQEALEKWNERLKRFNKDNLFILFSDRDNCTLENLQDFDNLPYKNKVVLTHIPYPNIKSAVYIKGFEDNDSIGDIWANKNKSTNKRYIDVFDYVKWLNG